MVKKPNAANVNISLKISHAEQSDLKKLADAMHSSQSAYVRTLICNCLDFERQAKNPALTDDYDPPGELFDATQAQQTKLTQEGPVDSNPGTPVGQ